MTTEKLKKRQAEIENEELIEQTEDNFNRAMKHAPLHQVMIALFWSIFIKQKAKELIILLEKGMSWKYAFNYVKRLPKAQPKNQ